MRILLFIVKNRYSNEIWNEMNQEARKINDEIRRWIKF
jgi:hypothetical protein